VISGANDQLFGLPLAYLLTFRCYGTWVPGDERGTVSRHGHNVSATPLLPRNPRQASVCTRRLKHAPIELDAGRRQVVCEAIEQVCHHRGWHLHALHVGANHVHAVVTTAGPPEHAMNSLKSWATRRMVEHRLVQRGVKPWARHGSTRYLWRVEDVESACVYVAECQYERRRDKGSGR
jgi:REP element-mobilizing transposase RayT